MATGGWGATGGGAWGSAPGARYVLEEDEEVKPPPQPSSSAYQAPPPQAASMPRSAYASAYSNPTRDMPDSAPYSSLPDISSREAQLKAKEAELNKKEKELKDLEAQLRASGVPIRRKNWPFCCPITYHSISTDIPQHLRFTVGQVYMSWLGLIICLCYNFAGACIMLGENAGDKVVSWFLAALYVVCGVPASWWLWYRRLYYAAKNDGSFGYLWFFIWYFVHIAFCVYCAVGFQIKEERWSFTGFISAMAAYDIGYFPGTIYIIGASLWSALGVFSFWSMSRVYMTFRGKTPPPPPVSVSMIAPR